MKTYTVTAKRWAHGWELHIPDVGVTQTKTLTSAASDAADYISLVTNTETAADAVDVVPQINAELDAKILKTRTVAAEFARMQLQVADLSRTLAADLSQNGLKGAEIAAVLGVSPQRVSQLTAPKVAKVAARKSAKSAPAKKRRPLS